MEICDDNPLALGSCIWDKGDEFNYHRPRKYERYLKPLNAWRENSGVKDSLKERNREIFNRYNQGASIKELTELYFLTSHSIRRIIRDKKDSVDI